MAQIAISVGPLTRTITAPDAKLSAVLSRVVTATSGPTGGTNAQKVDWVLGVIRRYLIEVADGDDRREVLEDAEAGRAPLDLNE